MQSSDTKMTPGSTQTHSQQRTAVWPWIVMPAVVLIVFCILHYDLRPLGNPKVTGSASASVSSGSSVPTE